MIKYRTRTYMHTIERVEIVRETPTQVVLPSGRREAKKTAYDIYHDTWQEAQTHLIDREWAAIETLSQKLERHRTNLDNVKELEPC